jgi:hypothetical protein
VRGKQESLLRGASLKRPVAKLAGWFPLAVSVSSFLLFSWLPLVKSSVNDFPLTRWIQFAGPLKASKADPTGRGVSPTTPRYWGRVDSDVNKILLRKVEIVHAKSAIGN